MFLFVVSRCILHIGRRNLGIQSENMFHIKIPPPFWGIVYGGTQFCSLPRYQSEEIKILNISYPQVVIKSLTTTVIACFGLTQKQ